MNLTVPRHSLWQKILCPGSLNPAALDAVKIVALLSMLVDHTNTLFLAKPEPLLYALGRMAFPLFTLIWAMNVFNNTARLQQRANRLWGWACLTQPAFTLAFHHQMPWYALNILFVFASVTQLLALHYRLGSRGIFYGGLILAVLVIPLTPGSFGLPGLLLAGSLVLVFSPSAAGWHRAGSAGAFIALFCLNGMTHLISSPADTLLFATIPTFVFPALAVMLARDHVQKNVQRFMPRHFFYFAYAGHLLLAGMFLLWMPVRA